jgi:hypothetical protein
MKPHVSALSPKSQIVLYKAMNDDDLKQMALLHDEVVKGSVPLSNYRLNERAMISKYGFKVRE